MIIAPTPAASGPRRSPYPRRSGRLGRLAAAVFVSSAGDPLSLTVSLVLVYRATHSPLSVAGIYGAQMLAVLTVGLPFGSLADRADRRRLIVGLELVRCLVVASLPLVARWSVFGLYPALFVLGDIEALVQPARQAAIPLLAGEGQAGRANALVVGAMTLGQAAGFASAGIALARLPDPRPLYLIDAASFAVSALLVARTGNLGGGVRTVRLQGGFGRAWSNRAARPQLLVAGAVVFFVGMLNPSLLPLAYVLSPRNGPTVYSILEVGLTAGLAAGSAVAGRIGARLRLAALAAAIFTFGVTVVAVGFSTALVPAAVAISLSGAGNAVYAVMNQTALLAAADDSQDHGTVMAARFAVAQAGKALGLASGAAVTAMVGARGGFAVIGTGLLVVAASYTWYLLRARPAGQADPAS